MTRYEGRKRVRAGWTHEKAKRDREFAWRAVWTVKKATRQTNGQMIRVPVFPIRTRMIYGRRRQRRASAGAGE